MIAARPHLPLTPPDTADLLSELEEVCSYVEVPQVVEHMQSCAEAWDSEQVFTKTPLAVQQQHIRTLRTTLNSPSSTPQQRHTSARHLLHFAHGCLAPGMSTSREHHLNSILTLRRVLRSAGALQGVWSALKRTSGEWEAASHLPSAAAAQQDAERDKHDDDEDEEHDHQRPPRVQLSEEEEHAERERQDRLDEINAELALLLAVLYFLVECFRGEEKWREELTALDPPMPIYLLNQVAGLREKDGKGYPVKKLLLLLWKSMLCTLGGMKDVARVKGLVREIEGLPKDEQGDRPDWCPWTDVAATDIVTFHNETLAKYPSYTPPPPSTLLPLPPQTSALASNPQTLDRLSAAASPAPVCPTLSYHINTNHDPSLPSNQPPLPSTSAGAGSAQWQPPTPAPSPPPSPSPALQGALQGQQQQQQGGGPSQPPAKPKKQQFQTDQSRPFPLPFAPANFVKGRLPVPRAVEEAGELYRKNLRVSTELWQAWKPREGVEREAIERERERQRREPDFHGKGEEGRKARLLGRRLEELILADKGRKASSSSLGSAAGDDSDASSVGGGAISSKHRSMLSQARGPTLDESALADGDTDAGSEEDEDPMDLLTVLRPLGGQVREEEERVEEGSKEREALATRMADLKRLERVEELYRATLPHLQSAVIVLLKLLLATVTANQNLPNAGQQAEPTSSDPPPDLSLEDCDIFRHREITSKAVSAILILTLKWFKLLVDSNCLLLILKMFGLQETSTLVRIKHDRADYNPRPVTPSSDAASTMPTAGGDASAPATSPKAGNSGPEEIELVSDFSRRNFFSTINFVHVLQKSTKRQTQRVLLMVQYKSLAILKCILKDIKSQVPYCGRKWRTTNVKVITTIYLHCRPDVRDEWLAGVDIDADVEESLPHERALRSLVRFFNTKHYSMHARGLHRRASEVTDGAHTPDFNPGPVASAPLPPLSLDPSTQTDGSSLDDVFPPARAVSAIGCDSSVPLRFAYGSLDPAEDPNAYAIDDLLLSSGGSGAANEPASAGGVDHDDLLDFLNDPLGASEDVWECLGLEGYDSEFDNISDSESVGSWGFMHFGDDGSGQPGEEGDVDERMSRHEWEHTSPDAITALEEERRAATVPSSPPA
ncbi:Factor arrest protein 11 [Rhodosporidiobolus nylandii]